jgi:hypothetical protein
VKLPVKAVLIIRHNPHHIPTHAPLPLHARRLQLTGTQLPLLPLSVPVMLLLQVLQLLHALSHVI